MMSDGMITITEARGTELIVNLPTLVLTYEKRIMMMMIMCMMMRMMMIVVKTMVVMIVIMMMDVMIMMITMIAMIMIIVVVIVHYPLTSPLIKELIEPSIRYFVVGDGQTTIENGR
jgi:hypothetical protein